MSKESMNKIQKAEAEADRIVRDAKLQAQKMIDEAEAEGRAKCEAAEAEISKQLSETLQNIREKTAETSLRVVADANVEADAITEEVKLRKKIAEKIILRGLSAKCR